MDFYVRVRRACHVEWMSQRQAAWVFGIDPKTVAKMLRSAVPHQYDMEVAAPSVIEDMPAGDFSPLAGRVCLAAVSARDICGREPSTIAEG